MRSPLAEDVEHILARTAGLWEPLRGQSVFITGGTGFVGTWLIESFAGANERFDLRASAVLLTRRPDAFRAQAPHLADHAFLRLLEGDVRSFQFPETAFPFMIHAATERYQQPTPDCPTCTFDNDVQGTRRVLDFARTHGTKRLLFTSSGAIYGRQPPQMTHIPEDYAGAPSHTDLDSAYGQAKRVSEWLCAMYARQYGFAALIARLFAFVGPHLPLDANFAVGNFIRDAIAGGPVRICGDGTPYRSYLYAGDLAIWLWTILLRGESARPYNVGSGDALTIAELARVVVDATAPGTRIEIAGQPADGTPAARYVPNVQRAERELQLRPLISLPEAIRRTYNWAVKHA
jgi:dTDP-glucose 4,6-dehydratase